MLNLLPYKSRTLWPLALSVLTAALADGAPAVRVAMLVDRSVQNRIRSDSVSSIGTMGLLGDRYVEIAMGTEVAAPLRDGGEINPVDPVGLNTVFERGSVALKGITELAANLNVVVEEFQSNVGGRKLADSVGAIPSMMEEIETGDGLLHSLVYDQYEGGGVESIERSRLCCSPFDVTRPSPKRVIGTYR